MIARSQVHLKARNHRCNMCGNRFARRDTLRRSVPLMWLRCGERLLIPDQTHGRRLPETVRAWISRRLGCHSCTVGFDQLPESQSVLQLGDSALVLGGTLTDHGAFDHFSTLRTTRVCWRDSSHDSVHVHIIIR